MYVYEYMICLLALALVAKKKVLDDDCGSRMNLHLLLKKDESILLE
jgi:hypothetical protein